MKRLFTVPPHLPPRSHLRTAGQLHRTRAPSSEPRHAHLYFMRLLGVIVLLSAYLLAPTYAAALNLPLNYFPRRRHLAAAAAALVLHPHPAAAKRLAEYTDEEREALDLSSRRQEGRKLASGVRVIDVTAVEDGRRPAIGDRVYVHYKVWIKGFRASVPVTSSYVDGRPYDWILGQPDERIAVGIDEGVRGMREGEWRRLIVPADAAYGERGLALGSRGAFAVPPGQPIFVDLLLLETAACDLALRAPGKDRPPPDFAHNGAQKSLYCKRVGGAPPPAPAA
jgi:FKBP-type peptidyl-prolyl cis-trans isomerase